MRTKPSVQSCILADEVTDISNHEQLGLVLRYLKNGQPLKDSLNILNVNQSLVSSV